MTALPDAASARIALQRLLGDGPNEDESIAKYQLIEEAVPHVPNLMLTLDADADVIRKAQARAWNGVTRKPWDELVACLGGAAPAKKTTLEKRPAAKAAKKTPKK